MEFICLFLLCLLLVGIPLLWMLPEYINPDTYIYLSTANYYLLDPSPTIKDAFTVGPVIPIVLAAIKYSISFFVPWSPDYDFLLVKLLVFISYFIIAIYSYKIIRSDCSEQISLIILLLILCLIPTRTDMLSLNGELACVAMLSVLHYSLQNNNIRAVKFILLATLSAVIIGTKIQAIPLLFLIIFSEVRNGRDLMLFVLSVAVAAASLEITLYLNGTGIFKNIPALLKYVNHANAATAVPGRYGYISVLYQFCSDRFPHLRWVLDNIFRHFPVYYIMVTLLVITVGKQNWRQVSIWILWFCLTVFTIWLPGYEFEHYVLFAIPFIWKFAGPVYVRMENSSFGIVRRNYSVIVAALISIGLIQVKIKPYLKRDPILLPSTISRIPVKFTMGDEMAEVRDMINRRPGRVLVHGFDYKCFVYLNTYNCFENDLSSLKYGVNDETTYTQTLQKNNFDYLLDIVGYCGIMRDMEYSVPNHKAWGEVLAKSHDLVYNKGGLLLFRKKTL
jgi:hypothetical protein